MKKYNNEEKNSLGKTYTVKEEISCWFNANSEHKTKIIYK